MKSHLKCLSVLILSLSANAISLAQKNNIDPAQPAQPAKAERLLPGMQTNGHVLLPTQWSLKPAGKHLTVGDFPTAIAFHPKQPFAAILHAGYGDHEIVVIDTTAEMRIISRATLPETFVGITFNSDGSEIFASGAEKEVVHQFSFQDGYLSNHRLLQITDIKDKKVPAGLALSADDKTLYAACPWGQSVALVPLDNPTEKLFISLQANDFPYSVLPEHGGNRLFVSLWGRASIAVINLRTKKVEAIWPTQSHPTEMVLSKDQKTLFVACANSNSVSVLDTQSGKPLETITSSLYPTADNGSTPNSISLSVDERVLLVANATNNNVALVDVSERGHSRGLGFIPVGWYPTSVRFNPTDGKILVANGKGMMPKANRQGPNPNVNAPKNTVEYIAGLFQGTISRIDPPGPEQMAAYTKIAYACSPLREDKAPVVKPVDANNPVPVKVGDASPIKHCIYIIKENRTYDQILGDLPQGNGDPALCIFPRSVTPNHHALAEQFVLLDNFYVESEVSADGHEWSMAAYATDFVEKTWPLTYRGSREGKLGYPAEGSFEIAHPSSGYIWDKALAAGVTYRSYGEFITNPTKPDADATARVKSLEGHFDPKYRGYDLNYRDVNRADRFLGELKRFEMEGEMPRLQIVRLPNDHTYGTSVGKLTPTAMVADNDLALGQLIEGLSHSKFWKDTVVFVVEDDAQNGSDHVDAHRSVAFVIGPHVKRKHVDSHMYSTSSMLRTMELILGMQPMTQFDGAALPMYDCFTAATDMTAYQHRPAQVDMDAVNREDAYGAKLSSTFDFSKEDAADDLLLNEVVWRSVRGADNPMPAPVRAGFVFADFEAEEEAEEEE
jgi:DNA-binding beta-propeller fold protein YncE